MQKIKDIFSQILGLIKNSILPILLLCATLICYFIFAPFNDHGLNILHICFFIIFISNIIILIYFNINKPFFATIIIFMSYLLINYFKFIHGTIYYASNDYLNLVFFSTCGFLFFYFLPNQRLTSKDSIKFLLLIFLGLSLGEFLSKHNIGLNIGNISFNDQSLQIFGICLFIIFWAIMLVHSSIFDQIINTTNFYAFINIFLGFYLSSSSTAFCLFFLNAIITMLVGTIYSIYYSTHKDTATGLGNGNSFIINAKNLPLKYGLGIISIDNYKYLAKSLKTNGTHELLNLIVYVIKQMEPEVLLYRYKADEFILIFTDIDAKKYFERLDKIRRKIALSEFMLSLRSKPLKITVSCSIAEKKRSDANIIKVFARARKALQKTYNFTQNVTSRG